MTQVLPQRSEVKLEHTWDLASIFPSDDAWQAEVQQIEAQIPSMAQFRGHLGDNAATLADWLHASETLQRSLRKVYVYARLRYSGDTTDQQTAALSEQAASLYSRAMAAIAFAEPEILEIDRSTLRQWSEEEPRLALYDHYFDQLWQRQSHIRSAEVEELLSQLGDPFNSAARIHGTIADADLQFRPARNSNGEEFEVAQGSINTLVTDPDRDVRRTAWESYADAHLALRHGFANCLATGVKQDVFIARARQYGSSLESALAPHHIPVAVFHNLIETYRRNLPTWHRYWSIRRRALGYDTLHVYDIKAPLTAQKPHVPYEQAVEWIAQGMQPLGEEYVSVLRSGALEGRWVDRYPNRGKRSGAYSSGAPGTHPFISMSYSDDLFGLSTLAHELGHSMHSYFTWRTQPFIYSHYSLFVAEVASNFNQALVRAHLLNTHDDPNFQIAVIEEAMSNFHRYFFIMPTLARFELEIHQRVERGEGLTAESMMHLLTDLFREGYGDEVAIDADRIGITWAEFGTHLYSNFYVYQYATGISAAHALAQRVQHDGPQAAESYLAFLRAGNSLYPLDALKLAGVDMTSPEPVEQTFEVLAGMVDRLEQLLGQGAEA